MQVISRLPEMDARQLATLEANARRIVERGGSEQSTKAEVLITAIVAERSRRVQAEAEARRAAAVEVRDRMKDLNLFDRVFAAFEAMPATQGEVALLRAVAANPNRPHAFIARLLGWRGGEYLGLAFGTMCAQREPYLGSGPPSDFNNRGKVHVRLLVDYTSHREADGSTWQGWTLKPDAEAALRHLGILARAAVQCAEQAMTLPNTAAP